MYGYQWMGGMWLVGLVCMAAFVFLVGWLVRRWGPQRPSDRRALALLEERYAKGELQREEFERMRHDIAG